MRKEIIIQYFAIIFLLSVGKPANGQLVIEWQKAYGGSLSEQPFMSAPTQDGGVISAGFSISTDGDILVNQGNYDWLIIKTDKYGNKEWARTYGGNNYDKCRAIMQNDDGTYMAFGSAHSQNGDLSQNYGSADFWLLRLDSVGNILYNTTIGGTAEEGGRAVIRTADRGWMLTGWTASNDSDIVGNHGSKDAWLCKLDSNMNIEWNQCYGGTLEDRARAVVELPGGGYVFGGNSKSNDGQISFNHGDEDFLIARVDAMGNLMWATSMGSTGGDRIFGLTADWDGGFVGSGRNGANDGDVTDNHGAEDLWITKVDSLGNIVWMKSFGGTLDDGGFRIETTPEHGYLVTGTTRSSDGDSPGTYGVSDYWFLKLDSALNIIQNDHLGGTRADHCDDIFKSQDGGYYMSGFSLSEDTVPFAFYNHGEMDFWIVKAYYCTPQNVSLSPSMDTICPGTSITIQADSTMYNYLWNTNDTISSIVVSDSGIYYLSFSQFNGFCTSYSDTVIISVHGTITPVITENSGNLTTTGTGTFQWFLNNIPITGSNSNTLSNVLQSGNYTVTVTDANNCASTSSPYPFTVGLNENSSTITWMNLFPNPCDKILNLHFISTKSQKAKLRITSVLGQNLNQTEIVIARGENKLKMDLNNFSLGAYIIHLIHEDGQINSKLFHKN